MRVWTPPDCFSDGETEDEMEVEDSLFNDDVENMPASPTLNSNTGAPTGSASSSTSSSSGQGSASTSTSSSTTGQGLSLSSTMSSSLAVSLAPPPENYRPLWASDWAPIPGRYGGVHGTSDFAKAVFEAASRSTPTNLVVAGRDVTGLAHSLIASIKAAVAINDFTPILSSRRSFNIVRDEEDFLSTGEGIEREVIFTAFSQFTEYSGTWFLPRFDSRCSIATTMSLTASSLVNSHRRDSLAILGCLSALMLIHGLAPEPLGPALIQFAANSCDLQSLTRDFVGEWHPDLRALLDSWIDMGPTGDLAPFQLHFATYHDMQVASLQSRDLPQHEALAADMLYTALIGPHPASHSEPKAFFSGFKMPCRNGFDFTEVLRSSPGGSASFISRLWTSIIHDFTSLQSHLSVFFLNRPTLQRMLGSETTNPILDMSLFDLLCDFLQGAGIPCPGLFGDARPRLSTAIPFHEVDSPAFRSRALCWAATGSPHVEFDEAKQVLVHFVDDQDPVYHSDPAARAALMKIARIPVLHLIDLCSRSYPTLDLAGNPVEPHTLRQAIDNWLLIEILAGVGNHTIL
ncbi:hypothetical protein C8R45DRAFT_1110642 [Mycena sanguinolenta]|nr:hypothetical protein C8R45DRAFT_1110642 [Mycena sanguinolenta]